MENLQRFFTFYFILCFSVQHLSTELDERL
jgi:hypothetical protein